MSYLDATKFCRTIGKLYPSMWSYKIVFTFSKGKGNPSSDHMNIQSYFFVFSSMFWALSNRLICTFQSSILRWCFWSYCSRWHMADDYLQGFAKFFIYFIKFTYQGNFQTFIKWSSKQLINLVLIIFFIELLLAKKISLLR